MAFTRHRDEVHLHADRKAYKDRKILDKLLSRPGRKDLAHDYATADLGRQAAKTEIGAKQASALRRQEQALKADLVTLDRAEAAKNHHRRTEIALQQAVRRVYAHPEEGLAQDPRRSQGVRPAGDRRGRRIWRAARPGPVLRQRRSTRQRRALDPRLALGDLDPPRGRGQSRPPAEPAARLQSGSTEIKVQLDRVTAALRQVAANARQPERALEIAVQQTSRAAIQTAVLILPSPSSYRCASPCGP